MRIVAHASFHRNRFFFIPSPQELFSLFPSADRGPKETVAQQPFPTGRRICQPWNEVSQWLLFRALLILKPVEAVSTTSQNIMPMDEARITRGYSTR